MTSTQNYEIDLLNLTLRFLRFLKRNFWIYFIATVVGFGGGLAKSKISKKSFETELVAYSTIVPNLILVEMVGTLNSLVKDKNIPELQKVMGISTEAIKSIRKITAKEIVSNIPQYFGMPERYLDVDRIKNRIEMNTFTRFRIILIVNDNSQIKEIQTGIVNYFNNNQYLKELNQLKLEQTSKLIQRIDEEINDLKMFQQETLKGSNKEVLIINQTPLQQSLIILYNNKLELEKSVKFDNIINIIEGFNSYIHPKSNLIKNLIIFGGGFFLLSFLVTISYAINKRI